ncbi:DNA-binding protein [Micromonospora sp. WMMD1102]|uniref:helix-turn-helix transcriptional regulator n=1 Tax=Micromonospora sp. WMMD1102 TaxID=3016105 RepID=UPI0024150969|nr:DNA-binding protein [Micromonospora sp. WMMD1102]MDG4788172.1 DNA-binding protein [Micromonospora sp. WMMD1102]
MASGPGELMGPYEIAEYLGVTRQRFQQIARRPGFPAPYQELRGMKVYLAAEIRAWTKENRPPRPGDGDEPG